MTVRVIVLGAAMLLCACGASRVDVGLPAAGQETIPPRAPNAMAGSAFIAAIAALPRQEREAAVLRELLAGNIPSFLRAYRTVNVSVTTASGRLSASYEVMPDYLAIGSDDDFVRMPMNPYTAQAFGDAFGFVLPTRKMANDIWTAARVHVEPRPLTVDRDSTKTFMVHHQIIEEQLRGQPRGVFVGGIKKDVVITNKLHERPNRVAIYGWHYVSGQPIQPLYSGHVDWYVDYSHGIRPVRRTVRVNGTTMPIEQVLADSVLHVLFSDEGVITASRYVGNVRQ